MCNAAWHRRNALIVQKQQREVLLRPFGDKHCLTGGNVFDGHAAIVRRVLVSERGDDGEPQCLPRWDPRPVVDEGHDLLQRHGYATIFD